MRDIKFRDYEPILKQMRYFDLDSYNRYEHDSYGNIMRYTGLTDRNSKEIYEGDVLKCLKNGEEYGVFEKVEFKHGCFWLDRRQISISGFTFLEEDIYDVEVIGNIHENPELL